MLYASVHAELGTELLFTSPVLRYTAFDCFTPSKLYALFWNQAVYKPRIGNNTIGIMNRDIESWQNMSLKFAQMSDRAPLVFFATCIRLEEKQSIIDCSNDKASRAVATIHKCKTPRNDSQLDMAWM